MSYHAQRFPKGSTPLYRTVECRLWDDDRFLALSAPPANAQTLWLYMLTGRSTGAIPGLCVFSIAEVAERFGWQIDAARACLAEVLDSGMARYDERTRLLWLPKALARRCNQPASPNVVRSWRRTWSELPESPMKQEAGAKILETLGSIGEGFAEAFAEAFAKGSRAPSPNQQTASSSTREDPDRRSRSPTKKSQLQDPSAPRDGHTARSRARAPTATGTGNLGRVLFDVLEKARAR